MSSSERRIPAKAVDALQIGADPRGSHIAGSTAEIPDGIATGRAASSEEAAILNGTDWDRLWTGDVWKAIVTLRARHPDLVTQVLDCDHGLGVIYRGTNQADLSLTDEQISAMTYADLARDATRLLGIRRPRYLLSALKQLVGRHE